MASASHPEAYKREASDLVDAFSAKFSEMKQSGMDFSFAVQPRKVSEPATNCLNKAALKEIAKGAHIIGRVG